VLATDDKYHLDYELVVTNALHATAAIHKVTVVDASDPTRILATYEGKALVDALRPPGLTHAPGKDEAIAPAAVRILFVDLAFPADAKLPNAVTHRFDLFAPRNMASTEAVPYSFTIAPVHLSTVKPLVLRPPLLGKHWVVINGCCGLEGAHRVAMAPVNGGIWVAQRYAIDYMRLDAKGRFFEGNEHVPESYADYNADVHAVANGTVVEALNTLDDQVPGKLPDPSTINIHNIDGNHVVLDLGNGYYAFFAHMRKGSVTVKRGDHVKAGQVIGKLGNTGNTSAPHLHFHIMDSASVLGSDGLPYVIDNFAVRGEINRAKLMTAKSVEGDYSDGLPLKQTSERDRFPLDLQILDFEEK
jgi:Peptidase family M23